MNVDADDVVVLLAALAGAVVAWVVLGQFGLLAQVCGAFATFFVVGKAVGG